MLSEKMRDEFEEWFEPDEDNRSYLRNLRSDDGYRLDAYYLNGCWNGYQAGAASRDAEVQRESRAIVLALRNLIANDAYAITFQTLGQYRTSLLNAIDAALKEDE